MLRLYIWGYLNQLRSSRMLERACVRDLEALWLMRRLAPDYRTIAAFQHDNPEAIARTGAAFVQFCPEQGLVGVRTVALDGTRIRTVASPKNIAGAERLARDIAHHAVCNDANDSHMLHPMSVAAKKVGLDFLAGKQRTFTLHPQA